LDDVERITHWSKVYAQHLEKWLIKETFTTHKTIVTYEDLQRDLHKAFTQITEHFGLELDSVKLQLVAAQVTKGEVKSKTSHDEQVIQLDSRYEMTREAFTKQSSKLIHDVIFSQRDNLLPFFEAVLKE